MRKTVASKIKERPIAFSTPMVESVMKDIKSMTRRIAENSDNCPFGKEGDILWVREEHLLKKISDKVWLCEYKDGEVNFLTANEIPPIVLKNINKRKTLGKWQRGRFLPKVFSRIKLEITKTRIEHLQEITDQDAISEGVYNRWFESLQEMRYRDYLALKPEIFFDFFQSPISSFQSLWILLNGPDSWNENPLVWVIEFKHLKN